MKKRIFSILVSLLMITSLVGIANAETETSDGQIHHIDLTNYFNSDSIASEGDTLDTSVWNGGNASKYGFPASLFTAADGYVTFAGRNAVKKDPNGNVVTGNMTVSDNQADNFKFYIPQEGLAGGTNDSVYQSANEEKTYTLNDASQINKIKFALHMFSDATITAIVNYSDGTSDSYAQGFQGSARNADSNKVVWSIYNNLRCFGWKWTTSSIKPNADGTAEKATDGGTDYYWGIRGYEIPVDVSKAPVSFTLKATNPISLFALAECEITNAELTAQLALVRAYEGGAYTAEQIKNIVLANSYADILVAKNAVTEESVSDIRDMFTKANNQKALAEIHYIDITDTFDSSTIGSFGETPNADTWFQGMTDKLNDNAFNGMQAGAFGNSDFVSFEEWANRAKTGNTILAYMPMSTRTATAVDSHYIPASNGTFTVPLDSVNTQAINFVLNTGDAQIFKAEVKYSDNTTDNYSFDIQSYGTVSSKATTGYDNLVGLKGLWWRFAKIDKDGKLADTDTINRSVGITMFGVKTDKTKTPVSITFTNTHGSMPVFMYAVSQVPVYSTEMLENIEAAKALDTKTGILTADEITAVTEAKAYADVLLSAGIGSEADYAFLTALLERANKQKAISEVSHFDISKDYNADTIGGVGETAGDTWFDGYTGFNGNFNGFNKTAFGTKEYFDAKVYELNSDGNKQQAGTISVYIPNVGRNAGENDSAALWNGKTLTVDINDVPTQTIRYLANNTETTVKATVYYKDGTTEEKLIGGTNFASTYYSTKFVDGAYLWLGGFVHKENNGVLTAKSGTVGIMVYNVAVDAAKIADKVVFSVASDTKPVYFYSVSQVPVSYETMKSALDAGFSGVYTDEDEATANKLANYKAVLTDAGAIASTAYPMVENYIKQANSQKNTYVDLTDYLNDDIMVKLGDSYAGITLGRTTELFDGERIPTDGMITMLPPSDSAQMSDETGRTYKLSGAYNGKGNDSVLIRKTDENGITIAVPEANGKVKGMGVILETNGGNDGTAVLVDATVNYSDNTSEDIKVQLQRSHGFNTAKMAAHSKDFGRLVINSDNTVANHEKWPNVDRVSFYSSNIEFNLDKTVSSITFKPKASDDYHIVAMTEYVYTNTELWDFVNAMSANDISGITKENADETIKGCEAVIELYNRGFTADIQEEDCSSYTQMLNYAKALKADEVSVDINVTIAEDGGNMKATAAMSNTTANAQDYVIVIAAYNANKLVGLNISAQGTLQSGDINKTDSVSLGKIDGAEYKAFVWESMSSLKPIYKAN